MLPQVFHIVGVACTGSNDTLCLTDLPQTHADSTSLNSILALIFGVLAAIAILVIVIQAIKFALSNGDPQKAADARKGVIYALVGLAVSLSAEVIVRVVIQKI